MVFETYDTLWTTRSRFIWKLEFLKKIYMKFNFLVTVLWGVFIVSLKNNWPPLLYKLMGYSMMARFTIHTLWNEFLSLLKNFGHIAWFAGSWFLTRDWSHTLGNESTDPNHRNSREFPNMNFFFTLVFSCVMSSVSINNTYTTVFCIIRKYWCKYWHMIYFINRWYKLILINNSGWL